MQRWADVDRVPAKREPGAGRRDLRDQRHRTAGAADRPGPRRRCCGTGGGVALPAVLAWAMFWNPRDRRSTMPACCWSTSSAAIRLPWPAIKEIDTKWSLTLITAYGIVRRLGGTRTRPARHPAESPSRTSSTCRSRRSAVGHASGPATRPTAPAVRRRWRSGGTGRPCATPATWTTRGWSSTGRRCAGTSASWRRLPCCSCWARSGRLPVTRRAGR